MLQSTDDWDDIEKEEGNEDVSITIPFNPSEINIKIIPRNIGQLVELMEDDQILVPRYQRLPNLWSNTKKSRFIESLMLDLPIPLFYFDEADDKKWYVVDGLQRMSTLEHFILGRGEVGKNKSHLVLENLEFLTQYNGNKWEELPRDVKRRINSNQVTINLIGKGTPDEVKYTIFSRINQGDVPLKAQEIRTALFQGYRVDFLEFLLDQQQESGIYFRKATDNSVKTKRQEDLDFVSRFLAFYLLGFTTYEPDLDRFITKGTRIIPSDEKKLSEIKANFTKALKLAFNIFGTDAFRKRFSVNDPRKPVNKPIFEVISVAFANLPEDEISLLELNSLEFRMKFIEFLTNNKKFLDAITTGTATKESVINRNTEFNTLLTTFINDKRDKASKF
ncbi:DUF262 domain-containing protein [Flectobacillus longus]|uniref:DUF262 domain-containing protein n=1 Tax=Flectobacillus longus TaxID=2984207 RepID=UPI0024B6F5A2|nr:DUF262 domain-containing protein [Flectobacillus longus]MDI9879780.1 DUF262 domain-containing protein [Flectobacillus longus]